MPAPKDKEVDFSNFFKNQPTQPNRPAAKPRSTSRRLMIMVILLIVLAAIEIGLLMYNKNSNPAVPEGYRWVQPENAPPRIEKIP